MMALVWCAILRLLSIRFLSSFYLMANFVHHDLRLLSPEFGSPLIGVIMELEHLRRLRLEGDTPPVIFHQLKGIFHMLESLGSARIEGNHTTLADYIETKVGGTADEPDQIREIENIEQAMNYIEDVIKPGDEITEHFIRELHALTVLNLDREGDRTPGNYRSSQVRIAQSNHLPPEPFRVTEYMTELVGFINHNDPPQFDLMKVALVHHRFGWIHPFGNGNGRVVRLLTYALFIKYGFNVKTGGRVLNPTAVFCNDRERYYAELEVADQGTDGGLEQWCHYVLEGVLVELKKVDRLTDYKYLTSRILRPAIELAREREHITRDEAKVLRLAVDAGSIRTGDLAEILPELKSTQRTYQVKKLVDRGMLQPVQSGTRQYTIGFTNSYLIRGVIRCLHDEGFIPEPLERP